MMAYARVLGGRNTGFRVEGHGRIFDGRYDSELAAAVEVVAPASLPSLRRAMKTKSGERELVIFNFIEQPAVKVARAPEKYWYEPVELMYVPALWRDGHEEFTLCADTYGDPDDGLPNEALVAALVAPYLKTEGATAQVEVDDDENDYGGNYRLRFAITLPVRGRSVGDAYAIGKGVLALYEAVEEGGRLTRETALDVLRSGRPDVLVGQRETDWIDFKREAYKKDDLAKFELSKDVAAFANASGGLLVLGVATVKSGEEDVASRVVPCATGTVSAQSYRGVVGRRVHPPPEGLEVFSIPLADGDVWVVSVPPQREEYKPFLVHGAVRGGKINDAFFSIVSRRDDAAVPTDPQAVHALLAAGRAALRH